MAFTFGAAAPAAGSSTSMFGAAPAQNNAAIQKPLFGGFSTPNPQQQQPQQQQPGQTGSLFGAQPAQPANPAPFSFGNSANSAAAPAAGQGGGALFGSMGQQQPQQQQNQTGSLFGNVQAKPASTSLFGSTPAQQPQQQQQQQGGSLFGNLGAPQQQVQPTTGLFGSTTQPPATQPSLFGSTMQTQPQNSLFGASQPQPQQQTQPFGQSSLFGNPASTQQPNQLSSSLFASTSGSQNVLGANLAPNQRPEVDIGERMMAVQRAWDTSNPECRFTYYFYNVVDPSQVQQYGRPANATDETKWIKALRDNPNPACMVPVLATGWADVKKRAAMQEQIASVHQQKIKEISQALDTLSRQSNLTTSIRLSALQTHLTQLQHRLIRLAAQSPAFIPSLQSSAIRPEEIEMKKTLDGVKVELDGKRGKGGAGAGLGYGARSEAGTPTRGAGGGGAKMLGQVNELWGQVEEIRRYRGRRSAVEREGWLADEKALGEVAEVLATQQMALQKLNDLANNAIFDADVMRQGLGLVSSHERKPT